MKTQTAIQTLTAPFPFTTDITHLMPSLQKTLKEVIEILNCQSDYWEDMQLFVVGKYIFAATGEMVFDPYNDCIDSDTDIIEVFNLIFPSSQA